MTLRITNIVLSGLLFLSIAIATAQGVNAQQLQGPRDNAQVFSGVVYGPIDPSDTLWRIASRYKQDSQFSIYQTMMAIYELNQQAFENGNFNTMVNGATLQLPSDRYIARIDPARARAKAELDDKAFGRPNSVRDPIVNDVNNANASDNLKPEVPLVNKDDLTQTQSQLQGQLNALKRQQQQQFTTLKNQVAASIDSVEALLAENKKLNERLLQIDENSLQLATTLESELQTQIDEQDAKLEQLIDMFKQEEARRIEAESKSILEILSSPTALILMTTGFTLLVLVGLAIFLLRKPAQDTTSKENQISSKAEDIVDDDLVIGEADELDADSDELMAALENDVQEDDILSDELEDDDAIASLADDDLNDALDLDNDDLLASIDGLEDDTSDDNLDDMLVPDSDDLSATTSVADVSNESENTDEEINLDGESDTASKGESSEDLDDDLSGLDDISDEDLASSIEETLPDIQDEVDEDGPPQGIDLDENGEIDENTLEQIEKQIGEKDAKLNQLADELVEALEGATQEEDEQQADIEKEGAQANAVADADNEALGEDTENDVDDLSDELLAELDDDEATSAELDQLLEEAQEENVDAANDLELSDSEQVEDTQTLDDEIEALLSVDDNEPGNEPSNEQDNDIDLSDDNSSLSDDTNNDDVAALAEELLQELEDEEDASDELDDLLNELDELEDLTDIEDSSDKSFDSSEQAEEISENELVEAQTEETDSVSNAKNYVDSDELLDDIPSFTSNLGFDEEDEELAAELELEPEVAVEPEPKIEAEPEIEPKPEPESEIEPAPEPKVDEEPELDPESEFDKEIDLSSAPNEDQDVLSALPGLDGWLDEEDQGSLTKDSQQEHEDDDNKLEQVKDNKEDLVDDDILEQSFNELDANLDLDDESDLDLSALELDDSFDSSLASSDDDALIEGLDDADFDEMLNDLANDESFLSGTDESDIESLKDTDSEEDKSKGKSQDPLEQAGLDLDALMTDDDKTDPQNAEDFLDVDDLLRDSEAMPEVSDADLDLNLENSLDKLVPNRSPLESNASTEELDSDQASNLDLAQVYMDMEDFDAAQELLDEVIQQGNSEQKSEALSLLNSIKR